MVIGGFGGFHEFIHEGDRLNKVFKFKGALDDVAVSMPVGKFGEVGLDFGLGELGNHGKYILKKTIRPD